MFTMEQLNNIPQLGQYEGNILDTFNFCTEEVQEEMQHLNIYNSTGPDMLCPRIPCAGQTCKTSHTHIQKFSRNRNYTRRPEISKRDCNSKKRKQAKTWRLRTHSLTFVVCKTIERLVRGRLITHLEMNNLIGDCQHKSSCSTSLLDFIVQVIDTYDTDNNRTVDLESSSWGSLHAISGTKTKNWSSNYTNPMSADISNMQMQFWSHI